VRKYIVIFGVTYALALPVAAILAGFLNYSGSTSIVTLLAAGFTAAARFVKDYQRVPNKHEKRVLVWGSLGASFAISGASVVLYLMLSPEGNELIQAIMSVPFVVGILIVSGVCLLLLHLSYGWFAGLCAKKIAAASGESIR
jgi:hypothetical protein